MFNCNNSKIQNKTERFFRDEILYCPKCGKDEISYCHLKDQDYNKQFKDAVVNVSNMQGGKQRKTRKTRKTIKPKKTRKTRKPKKTRKN